MLENSSFAKYFLLFIAMLGTSMVIGDGVITPCVSVLSAVSGIRETSKTMTDDTIMWISVVILIILFQLQRFGTDKIGYMFSPILTVWFIFIGSIGFYNFIKYDSGVIKAINPVYILHYFIRNKNDAWISLGGILLCLTGSEALFADLGHFYVRSIQISTCCLVFPSIVLAYTGQAAYLQKHRLGRERLPQYSARGLEACAQHKYCYLWLEPAAVLRYNPKMFEVNVRRAMSGGSIGLIVSALNLVTLGSG